MSASLRQTPESQSAEFEYHPKRSPRMVRGPVSRRSRRVEPVYHVDSWTDERLSRAGADAHLLGEPDVSFKTLSTHSVMEIWSSITKSLTSVSQIGPILHGGPLDHGEIRMSVASMSPDTFYEFEAAGERKAVRRLADGTVEFYSVESVG